MRVDPGQYEVRWVDPRSGEYSGSQNVSDGAMFMKNDPKHLKSYLVEMTELVGALSEACLISQ